MFHFEFICFYWILGWSECLNREGYAVMKRDGLCIDLYQKHVTRLFLRQDEGEVYLAIKGL